jgi:hypothetical protein
MNRCGLRHAPTEFSFGPLYNGQLLRNIGFKDIHKCEAHESRIPDWPSFQLDISEGQVRKPDSLFMEATKS